MNKSKNYFLEWTNLQKKFAIEGSIVNNYVLVNANIDSVNLRGIDLKKANFEEVDLREADFRKVNLEGANFKNSILIGTNFEGANLTNANLENANCEDANLLNTTLTGANLKGTNLEKTGIGVQYLENQIRDELNEIILGKNQLLVPQDMRTRKEQRNQIIEKINYNKSQRHEILKNKNRDKNLITILKEYKTKEVILSNKLKLLDINYQLEDSNRNFSLEYYNFKELILKNDQKNINKMYELEKVQNKINKLRCNDNKKNTKYLKIELNKLNIERNIISHQSKKTEYETNFQDNRMNFPTIEHDLKVKEMHIKLRQQKNFFRLLHDHYLGVLYSKEVDDKNLEGTIFFRMGEVYKDLGYNDNARHFFKQSFNAFNAINSPKSDLAKNKLNELF